MVVEVQSRRPFTGPCTSKFYLGKSTREQLVFDFSLPETQERYASEVAKGQRLPLDIENIRGRESEFTLWRNGFQYVHHEPPPELRGEAVAQMTEDEVAKILVPPTEELVKKV